MTITEAKLCKDRGMSASELLAQLAAVRAQEARADELVILRAYAVLPEEVEYNRELSLRLRNVGPDGRLPPGRVRS